MNDWQDISRLRPEVYLYGLEVEALAESCPAVWHRQEVAVHGRDEAGSIFVRRHNRWQLALAAQQPALLHHRLQLLVPRECSNVV